MALNQKQWLAIQLFLNNPTMPITKVAEEIGVNRNTVSFWKRKNEEFIAEYRKALAEKWKDSEGVAVDTMTNLAATGSFQASKYILDNMGYAPAQKIEAKVDNDVIINIVDDKEETEEN